MATRSFIAMKDGTKYRAIYVHWDGDNHYNTLYKNYNTKEKVNELLDLGDLSILGEKIGEKIEFDKYDVLNSNECLAYGRDRGETGVEAKIYNSKKGLLKGAKYMDAEYCYIFNPEAGTASDPCWKKLKID